MSVKLALLKSGETVIADIKELISDEKLCGYLFKNPQTVDIAHSQPTLLVEDSNESDIKEINIVLNPWIVFTKDTEIPVRPDWVVTVVEPHNEILNMYEDNLNGQSNQSTITE